VSDHSSHFDLSGKKVWVAGHGGMVGSALARALESTQARLITIERAELDLRRQAAVESWMAEIKPDAVFIAAATVGGIYANDNQPAEFIHDNLTIASNIIHAAHVNDVRKLLFIGSSCCYPKFSEQPIKEESLLTGALEPTNQWYAVAKIAGIKMCQAYRRQYGRDYISVIPTSVYGPGDNFDPAESHVIPAVLRKVVAAKDTGGAVEIWGTGRPEREFIYVDDAARALVFLMENYSDEEVINVGAGETATIAELAQTIGDVVGFDGAFIYDKSKPDGMPKKQLDSSRILKMGWKPLVPLKEGLNRTYEWLKSNPGSLRI